MRLWIAASLLAALATPAAADGICTVFQDPDANGAVRCAKDDYTSLMSAGPGTSFNVKAEIDPAQCGRIGFTFFSDSWSLDSEFGDSGPMAAGQAVTIEGTMPGRRSGDQVHIYYAVTFYDPPCEGETDKDGNRSWKASVSAW